MTEWRDRSCMAIYVSDRYSVIVQKTHIIREAKHSFVGQLNSYSFHRRIYFVPFAFAISPIQIIFVIFCCSWFDHSIRLDNHAWITKAITTEKIKHCCICNAFGVVHSQPMCVCLCMNELFFVQTVIASCPIRKHTEYVYCIYALVEYNDYVAIECVCVCGSSPPSTSAKQQQQTRHTSIKSIFCEFIGTHADNEATARSICP